VGKAGLKPFSFRNDWAAAYFTNTNRVDMHYTNYQSPTVNMVGEGNIQVAVTWRRGRGEPYIASYDLEYV
jgi:hypothetical protein